MKYLLLMVAASLLLTNCHRRAGLVKKSRHISPKTTALQPPGYAVIHSLGDGESLADTISMDQVRRSLQKKDPAIRTRTTGPNSFEAIKDTNRL